MPRRSSKKSSAGNRPAPPQRERFEARRKRPTGLVDKEALELRELGTSYSGIARRLDLHRATDAHGAFLRALRLLDGEAREQVTTNEERRLDELEVRIRERDATEPEKIDRRVAAVERLRASLH